MTPREKREMLTQAIIDDILENPSRSRKTIHTALWDYYSRQPYQEIENEYKERATL